MPACSWPPMSPPADSTCRTSTWSSTRTRRATLRCCSTAVVAPDAPAKRASVCSSFPGGCDRRRSACSDSRASPSAGFRCPRSTRSAPLIASVWATRSSACVARSAPKSAPLPSCFLRNCDRKTWPPRSSASATRACPWPRICRRRTPSALRPGA